MITLKATKDTFISEGVNCCLYHNHNAKTQITFYLPEYQEEKKFRFFVKTPKKIILRINNEKDSFWNNPDAKELVLAAVPGVDVSLEAILGKWQITSNSPLNFR